MLRNLTLVFLAALLPLRADPAGDGRLRDMLRSTVQALNAAEAEKATLQSAQADNEKRIQELTGQVQVLIKHSVADKAAADRAAAAAAARLAERDKEALRLREELDRARTEIQRAQEAGREGDKQREQLAAENLSLQRQIADAKAKNAALFKIGNEILTRYENYSLGNVLLAKEPFVGLTRVKLENQVQAYEDKLLDQRTAP